MQTIVTIDASESQSAVVDLGHYTLCGIRLPAAWTTAGLTFLASYDTSEGKDAASYVPIYDADGVELAAAAAADRHVVISPAAFAGVRWLKIRSGTAASPVAQAAERTLILITRPVT